MINNNHNNEQMEPRLVLLYVLMNVIRFELTVLWNVPALTELNVQYFKSGAHGLKRYEPDSSKQSLFTPLLAVCVIKE